MSYHPIYNAYGAQDYLNNLRGEFDEIPQSLRDKWTRKSRRRAWLLAMTGQTLLEKEQIPADANRILWFYDWNTLGDSIMDLSQRQSLADYFRVDVCMPSGPAELFTGDPAFEHVYTNIDECPTDYDFILLHDISSRSIGIKLRKYFFKPWASMIRHQQGEQFARAALSTYRLGQFLEEPNLKPRRPSIAPTLPPFKRDPIPLRIAVAIGGIDPRRRYTSWPIVLEKIAERLGDNYPLKFVLIGSGSSSHDDLAKIPKEFLQNHCELALDLPDLIALRDTIARCHLFLGGDSGPMHMAEALDIPGLALFGHIRPEWRLLPTSRLATCFDPKTVNNIPPNEILSRFFQVLHQSKVI